ncbi:LysR family transcriptional regulator [Vibrio mediterranei]|uniref:LysR family transcriptional regulator n=1 Tax=Vibrio mediterranei TaxID=689 RepID=A0ABX5DBB6_9VIBR|nr:MULTISPECIES: LysR family transcriptional regulator [Vibrio]MCG9626780.1 LysR family transcriptional regulator [Vibrio mediterranei]MCG9789767.1 LysR family transcriptional regulator [Vibrio mediterranei]NOI25035.1 LysR family transcriptional regulator [Vibrio mediterranei]PCD86556.1 LysR family transcriptional regulator [Vibrio mediterranei]PRQ66973.1 LysR family transcriptional regulator [Vibrio mediterranei]
MDDNLLRRLDFNTLKLLKVLGEERNTKRAADRMFLSQPAVSKQLKKLREEFADELFIRKQYGLEPTPYCLELLEKLPALFELLEDLFSRNQQFNPALYTGDISIAINTTLYRPVSRRLYHHLRPLLPNATLKIINWGQDTEHDLKLARLHIGINYLPLDISKQVIQKKLTHCYFKLICRDGHPVLETQRTTQDIGQYPLALLQLPDFNKKENLIETKLREVGITPQVGLRADQLSICLHVVAQTDSILPCVDIFDADLPQGTQFFSAHKEHQLGSDIGALIPSKLSNAPLVKWLYSEVRTVFEQQEKTEQEH